MTFYTAVKIVHVLAIISWMAAILYLPRLFVYHADTNPQSDTSRLLSVMERRLLRGIMTPAMIAAWLTGGWMAVTGGFTHDIWFMVKLAGCRGFVRHARISEPGAQAFGAGAAAHIRRVSTGSSTKYRRC